MTKEEIIKALRDMARYPTVTLPRDSEALKVAADLLAQPEQEPVAWMLEEWGPDCGPCFEIYHDDEMGWRDKKEWTPLYTSPPQRKPLTGQMTKQMRESCDSYEMRGAFVDGWLSAEAAHGIKENT